MSDVIFLAVIVNLVLSIMAQECGSKRFINYVVLDNYTINDVLLWKKPINQRALCAAECYGDVDCVSFQHTEDESVCRAYPVGMKVLKKMTLNWVDAAGSKTYILEERDRNRFGSPCTKITDCPLQYAECDSGHCRCMIGFSFNPKSSHCVRSCTTYGDYYSMYEDSRLLGNDFSSFGSDLSSCLKRCSSNDTCRSFDYDREHRVCYLQNIGWLDATFINQGHPGTSVKYGHRHCRV